MTWTGRSMSSVSGKVLHANVLDEVDEMLSHGIEDGWNDGEDAAVVAKTKTELGKEVVLPTPNFTAPVHRNLGVHISKVKSLKEFLLSLTFGSDHVSFREQVRRHLLHHGGQASLAERLVVDSGMRLGGVGTGAAVGGECCAGSVVVKIIEEKGGMCRRKL